MFSVRLSRGVTADNDAEASDASDESESESELSEAASLDQVGNSS